jgi:chromosomal replication initiator protein
MNEVWQKTLEQLKTQLSKPTFEMWFKNTKVLEETDFNIKVAVPSEFARDWIQTRYLSLINSTIKSITEREINVEYIVVEENKKIKNNKREDPPRRAELISSLSLNDRYTFDNFVVGASNRFAHAACYSIVSSPGVMYNPLFIYGDVGLGKTHLLQAIAHAAKSCGSGENIVYTTSEKFTNEVVYSIQEKKMNEFHEFYRSVDFLIIDDIQFLAGKERTQEEFFHTFNVLYDAKKQIALSSDKPPKDLVDIVDRLKTRFQMGLMVDIQPPDYETRIAILQKKAELENLDVTYEVLEFIANQPFKNIRELEGTLIRLLAYASLNNKEITIELAREVLKDIVNITNKVITIDEIKATVADYFNITKTDLDTKRRSQDINTPRQIAIYLTRTLTDYSLPMIGRFFGGRDHSTIIHSYEKIKKEILTNETLKVAVEEIVNKLRFS